CNSPAKSFCPSGMSFRWGSSHCLLKCDPNRRQPVFMKIKKRWCEHVIQNDGYCTPCDGDRDSFLAKHNGSLTVCNRTKELLWKSSLCNRVIECSDKEDELNCPKECQITEYEFLGNRGVMKRGFRFQTRYELSHCSYCLCNNTNGYSTCYKKGLNGIAKEKCSKCSTIIKEPCSYCEKPGNRSIIIPSMRSVNFGNETECISCNCTKQGTISCRYKDIRQPICGNTQDCETLLARLPKHQCTYCVDPLNGQKKIPLTSWNVQIGSDNFKCVCSYEGDLVCSTDERINGFMYSVQCSKENCTNLMTNPDCRFQNHTIRHRQSRYVSMYELAFCFECTCFFGQVQCRVRGRSDKEKPTRKDEYDLISKYCNGDKECSNLALDGDVKRFCSKPAIAYCPSEVIEWSATHCNLTCEKPTRGRARQPNYIKTQTRWCDNMVFTKDKCAPCQQDKEKILAKYEKYLVSCNSSNQYVWIDQICDSYKDCINGEDERNCTKFYCRFDRDKHGYDWPSREENATVVRSCASDPVMAKNFSRFGLRGNISRKCVRDEDDPRHIKWKKTMCACIVSDFPFFNSTTYDNDITLLTFSTVINALQNIHKHILKSPSNFQHLYEINKILRLTHKLLTYSYRYDYERLQGLKGYRLMKPVAEMFRTQVMCHAGEEYGKPAVSVFVLLGKEFDLPDYGFGDSGSSFVRALGATYYTPQARFVVMMEDERLQENKHKRFPPKINETHQVHPSSSADNRSSSKKIKKVYIGHTKDALDKFEEVLSGMSIACLVVGLTTFRFVKEQNMKYFIHQNLMIALLCKNLFYKTTTWFIPNLPHNSKAGCFTVSILSYFFTLSTFSWMMVEGINIIIIVIFVFKGNRNYHKQYLAIGYGVPFLLTSIFGGVFNQAFADAIECVVLQRHYLWVLRGPICFYLLVNGIFFICILMKLRQVAKQRKNMNVNTKSSSSTKTFLVLVPLLGIPFILAPFVEYSIYIAYTFVIMNGLTGVYLLVGHVIMDVNVRKDIDTRFDWLKQKTVRMRKFSQESTRTRTSTM
uniref:G-protein coupled receptors family 2 profile 2 domain-containing protein n=2 Tax=Clytia hemisphaerica TaxID=252671 RepID=A0A7M5WI02_9CNID